MNSDKMPAEKMSSDKMTANKMPLDKMKRYQRKDNKISI